MANLSCCNVNAENYKEIIVSCNIEGKKLLACNSSLKDIAVDHCNIFTRPLYDALFMFKPRKQCSMIFTNMLELINELMKLMGWTENLLIQIPQNLSAPVDSRYCLCSTCFNLNTYIQDERIEIFQEKIYRKQVGITPFKIQWKKKPLKNLPETSEPATLVRHC